jgi:phosphohistidine phosphatase
MGKMKKLIFIRHGRAEDPAPEFSDFERSLTPKGKAISKCMAHELMEKENSPGIMITSPAFRALETALIFAGVFGVTPDKILINSNLYYKMNFKSLNEILSLLNEDNDTISFFGHNPSFSEITNSLCSDGCDFMPKCGVVGISFNIRTWSDIRRNIGKIEYFLKPEKVL